MTLCNFCCDDNQSHHFAKKIIKKTTKGIKNNEWFDIHMSVRDSSKILSMSTQ